PKKRGPAEESGSPRQAGLYSLEGPVTFLCTHPDRTSPDSQEGRQRGAEKQPRRRLGHSSDIAVDRQTTVAARKSERECRTITGRFPARLVFGPVSGGAGNGHFLSLSCARCGRHAALTIGNQGHKSSRTNLDIVTYQPSLNQINVHRRGWTRGHCALILLRTKQRSEEHTSELQSPCNLVCRLL